MSMEMYDKICRMVEADIEELVAKGSLEPHEYQCLGEAIDIVKDIKKIKEYKMAEEGMMGSEDMASYAWSNRVPRMNMRWSNARGGSQEGSYGSYAQSNARGGSQEGSYESYAQGGSNGYSMEQGSQYNPNRSPITGRYTSNNGASYHDMDGSMKKDLEELLSKAKDDHDRMVIMRLLSKIEQ